MKLIIVSVACATILPPLMHAPPWDRLRQRRPSDWAQWRIVHRLTTPSPLVRICFSADSQLLAAAAGDDTIRVWNIGRKKQIAALLTGHVPYSLSFHPRRNHLAVGYDNGSLGIWDLETKTEVRVLTGHSSSWVTAVGYSHDGALLASGDSEGLVLLRDARTRRVLRKGKSSGSIFSAIFTPGDKTLVTAGMAKRIDLWRLADWSRSSIPEDGSAVDGVAVSADGTLLACDSAGASIKIWALRSRKQAGSLQGHRAQVLGLAFAPAGHILASSSYDASVRIWDVRTNRQISLLAHPSAVAYVTFSPNGRMLATGCGDGSVLLWERQ